MEESTTSKLKYHFQNKKQIDLSGKEEARTQTFEERQSVQFVDYCLLHKGEEREVDHPLNLKVIDLSFSMIRFLSNIVN